MLNKLQHSMQAVEFVRHQRVYSEGTPSLFVYFVYEGEFLLSKRMPVLEKHEVKVETLIGPDQKSIQKDSVSALARQQYHGVFKLISLMQGQMFGEGDVVNCRPRLATATCVSHTGTLIEIEAGEFIKKLQAHDETYQEMLKGLYAKQV